MNEKQRIARYLRYPETREMRCWNCIHFRQHYVRFGEGFLEAGSGHCVFPRVKPRRCYDTCAHHVLKPMPTEPEEEPEKEATNE